MVISYSRRVGVTNGYTHAAVFSALRPRIRFARYNDPTKVLAFSANPETHKLTCEVYNEPTKLFRRSVRQIPGGIGALPFECRLHVGVELEADGGRIGRTSALDATVRLSVLSENLQNVRPAATMNVFVSLICKPEARFTPEECFTDKDLDVVAPSPVINRWF